MTRFRAIQCSALAAAGTFLLTMGAVWVAVQSQPQGVARGAEKPTMVAAIAPPVREPAPEAPADNLRDTNDVRVYKAVKDAVVNITSSHTVTRLVSSGFPELDQFPPEMLPAQLRPHEQQVQLQSLGTGFVIHPAGYIITNEHVIELGTDIQCVFVNGNKLAATVIATDDEHDLAVLKVNPPKPLPALTLGASEDLMIGEPVYAIGNPFGFAGTMTRGIVSALDRSLDVSASKTYKGLIQTDASINPGNSGGPLLNAYGQVIGINTAIRQDAQGIGFAINVSSMRDLLPAFLNPEALDRAQVGFSLEEVRSIASPSHVAAAVIVKQVQTGSAAAKAGIQVGDKLIRIGHTDVANIVDALVPIAAATPGDTLNLTFTRINPSNSKTTLEATLAVGKPPPLSEVDQVLLTNMGIKAQSVTAALVAKYKLPVKQGVYIESVEPNSPASQTGIVRGDVLLQLGRYPVNSVDDVATLLKTVKEPVQAPIAILRGSQLGRGMIALK